MSETVLFALLRTSVAVAVTGLFVFLALRWSRCRSSRIHRIGWAFVLLQGVLWIRVPLELPILTPEVPPAQAAASFERSFETPFPEEFSEPMFLPTESSSEPAVLPEPLRTVPAPWRVEPTMIAFGIWAAGLAVIVLLRCFGLYRLMRQMRSAKPVDEEMSHGKRFRILLTDHFGPAIFRNTIFVPESLWEESSEAIRRGVLKHELSHARHRDGLKSFLLSLATMIHWFNPLAWFALKKFDEAAEWRCDSEAFGSEKNGIVTFAESMLVLNRSVPRFLAWVHPYKNSDLKERVRRLKEHHFIAKESIMKQFGILCLVIGLFCFSLVKVQLVAQAAKPETDPVENKQEGKSNVPKIVKMFPENNIKDVDPNISQVYLTFDRPMGTGMAWAQRDDNTALTADVTDKIFWTEDRRTCVAPVQLKPNKTYEILLNMKPFIGFCSVEGVPSEYVFYTFTTGEGPVDTKKREELAKNLFVKPDPNNPSKPPALDSLEKDGKFFLKTESGEMEAAPLASAPIPEMKESDYFIQSLAFRKVRILGASLEQPSKEEYEKLDPGFSSRYPTGGFVVRKLGKGFRADQAGLRTGDIILGFDQYQMANMSHLRYFTAQRPDRDIVIKFWVLRGDKLYYVDIPVESMAVKKPADGGFVTEGRPDVSGFTHLVTFKPKGDFNPRNPGRFLAPFRTKLIEEGPITGYFRTKAVDGKLVGSLCTGDPEGLERLIKSVPEIEFVQSERLAKESFEAYEKTKQESLPPVPPADGGFATTGEQDVAGFTHIVTWGPKGDFNPRTPGDYLKISHAQPDSPNIFRGYFRTKNVDGKLIASNLTDAPEDLRKMIESTPQFEYIKTERLTEKMFEDYEKTPQESLSPADGGFATPGEQGMSGFTHIVVFAPQGDFAPKTVKQLLDAVSFPKMNEYDVQLGYFRTKPVDGKLIGAFLTADPEKFEKMIESIPNLKFLSSERLTKEKFEEYEKQPQLSLLDAELGKRFANEEWFKKLNEKQRRRYRNAENAFPYVFDPKNFKVGNARSEFEKKWVKQLEGPEPGFPGRTQLSTYDEAILGLATIKSDKAAPLLVKIACERVVKDNAHRFFATRALGMLGDPSVVPDLIPLLYHYNVDCRWETQIALVRLTGQNFGGDDQAWGKWYNENRDKLGKNLPAFDPTPVDWTCGSSDPEFKKWADREEQKKMDDR